MLDSPLLARYISGPMTKTANVPVLTAPKALPGEHPMALLEKENPMSPEFRKLGSRQRAFVLALIELGGRPQEQAAAMAGYTGTPESIRVSASRLAADPRVQAALVQEAQAFAKSSSFHAVATVVQIMGDETASKSVRLQAAARIMALAGMEPGQQINVNHNHGVASGTAEEIARVISLSREIGLDPVKLLGKAGITIDAEYEVVGEKTGLEDLL